MRRDLEDKLRERIRSGVCARDAIGEMLAAGDIASPKQAWRTLEKWSARREYEYGVCLDLGWLLPIDVTNHP